MKKKYRWIISGVIYAVAFTYLFFPLDFIPDALPAVGQIDDAVGIIIAIGADKLINKFVK